MFQTRATARFWFQEGGHFRLRIALSSPLDMERLPQYEKSST